MESSSSHGVLLLRADCRHAPFSDREARGAGRLPVRLTGSSLLSGAGFLRYRVSVGLLAGGASRLQGSPLTYTPAGFTSSGLWPPDSDRIERTRHEQHPGESALRFLPQTRRPGPGDRPVPIDDGRRLLRAWEGWASGQL